MVDVAVTVDRRRQRHLGAPGANPLVKEPGQPRVAGIDQDQALGGLNDRRVGEPVPEADPLDDLYEVPVATAHRMVGLDRHGSRPQLVGEAEDVAHRDCLPHRARQPSRCGRHETHARGAGIAGAAASEAAHDASHLPARVSVSLSQLNAGSLVRRCWPPGPARSHGLCPSPRPAEDATATASMPATLRGPGRTRPSNDDRLGLALQQHRPRPSWVTAAPRVPAHPQGQVLTQVRRDGFS
jgi:hypothetical protein